MESRRSGLGSDDWMERNLRRRVEVLFPILDPHLKERVRLRSSPSTSPIAPPRGASSLTAHTSGCAEQENRRSRRRMPWSAPHVARRSRSPTGSPRRTAGRAGGSRRRACGWRWGVSRPRCQAVASGGGRREPARGRLTVTALRARPARSSLAARAVPGTRRDLPRGGESISAAQAPARRRAVAVPISAGGGWSSPSGLAAATPRCGGLRGRWPCSSMV